MKLLIIFLILVFSYSTLASTVTIGCNEQKLFCQPDRDCVWSTAIGQIKDLKLSKDGTGQGYKFWKGTFSGFAYGQFPFKVSISQKVDLDTLDKTNFIKINLEVDDIEVSGSGITKTSVNYNKNDIGVGIICTTNF